MIQSMQLPCVVVTISSNRTSAYIGDIITLTVQTIPYIEPYTIGFIEGTNIIGSCTTSVPSGICSFSWNTEGLSPGTYTITANVGTQCQSITPVTITLSPATMFPIILIGLTAGLLFILNKKS